VARAKITVTDARGDPAEHVLGHETILGRSARCPVQLDGDLVSRQHARVYHEGGRWFLEDLGSRNGTHLNDVRVTGAELSHGDVILIGYSRIVFELPEEAARTVLDLNFSDSDEALEKTTIVSAAEPAEDLSATAAVSYRDLVIANQRIATIVRIGHQLGTLLERDALLDAVTSTLFELFPQADRAAVVLRAEGGAYKVMATRERTHDPDRPALRISRNLFAMVRRERKAVLSRDVGSDERFADDQSIQIGAPRSILCAPLQHEGEFFGVLFLESVSVERPFRETGLNMLQAVAAPVALSLRNAELVARIEREASVRASLSRYLSPDVVERLRDGSLTANLGGEAVRGSVMFTDLVGFTALAERLRAAEVMERLNRYFEATLEVLFNWRGTVDKFGGDAVVAVWGAPVANERHARMACAAGLEMQGRLFELNLRLTREGASPFGMAVGVNTGRFVAGNIGGEQRVEWTVIGDAVNLAQRAESAGFAGSVLATDATLAEFRDDVGALRFAPIQVKGREQPVLLHSIRVLRTRRGTLASIPGMLGASGGETPALLVQAHGSGKSQRLTLKAPASPARGEVLDFETRLPESPAALAFRGRVVSTSPLLDRESGRSIDVMVDAIDPVLDQLLAARGSQPAPERLEDIPRSGLLEER